MVLYPAAFQDTICDTGWLACFSHKSRQGAVGRGTHGRKRANFRLAKIGRQKKKVIFETVFDIFYYQSVENTWQNRQNQYYDISSLFSTIKPSGLFGIDSVSLQKIFLILLQ